FTVAYFYHRYQGVKSIIIGMIVGTVGMAVIMSVLNYFIILPAYSLLVGMEMNETIKSVSVVGGVLPFNFIKGVIVSILFIPIFIKLSEWINQIRMQAL